MCTSYTGIHEHNKMFHIVVSIFNISTNRTSHKCIPSELSNRHFFTFHTFKTQPPPLEPIVFSSILQRNTAIVYKLAWNAITKKQLMMTRCSSQQLMDFAIQIYNYRKRQRNILMQKCSRTNISSVPLLKQWPWPEHEWISENLGCLEKESAVIFTAFTEILISILA